MLQDEFIKRGGKIEDYAFANGLYNSTNMNKDEFCKAWVTITESKQNGFGCVWELIQDLVEHHNSELSETENAKNEITALYQDIAKQAIERENYISDLENERDELKKRYDDLNSYSTRLECVASKMYNVDAKLCEDILTDHLTPSESIRFKIAHSIRLSDSDKDYIQANLK
jgi:hypothetical protein